MRPRPLRLFALSGSLRAASSHTAALWALARLAPPEVSVVVYQELGELPPFNPDLDGEGAEPPPAVARLRSHIRRAHGLLLTSPEYAHGVPGVLKNALDWLVSSTDLPGKPVALLNLTPSSLHVHASLCEILRTMSVALEEGGPLTVPLPRRKLDTATMLADPEIALALEEALAVLIRAVEGG